MSEVIATCQKCGFVFKWFMSEGAEMPDCPQCGFNPISSQRDSGVDQLLADLQSSDMNKRNNAAVFLGERGEKRAAEPLLKIFQAERENVPEGVLVALGELKEERAIDLILELIPDSDLDPKAHMLGLGTKTLAKIGAKKVLPIVMKNLRYLCVPWPVEVKEALKAFVEIGQDSIPILLEGLDVYKNAGASSVIVRKEIIWALGKIGQERSISDVKRFLPDKNAQLAKAATDALVLLKWEPETNEEDVLFMVQKGDVDALRAKGQAAINPLVSVLMSGVSRKAKTVVANLLSAMSWSPANDEEEIEAFIARGELEDLSALGSCVKDAMVSAMMDEDYEDRLKIPEALIKIDDPGIYDVLLHAFKQVHCWELSRSAAKALGMLGDKRAIEHFIEDLKASWVDEQLGCACANALGELADQSPIEILTPIGKVSQSAIEVLAAVADKDGQYESLKYATLKAIEKIKKAHPLEEGVDEDSKDNIKIDSKDVQGDLSDIDEVFCSSCNAKILRSEADANKGLCDKCAWEKNRVSCKNCDKKVIRSIYDKNNGLCVHCVKDEEVVKKFGKKRGFFRNK